MTFEVLNKFDGLETDKHSFYDELNRISYYNTYFRIRDELIEKGIIELYKKGDKTMIKLTVKGLLVQNSLKELEKLLDDNHELEE